MYSLIEKTLLLKRTTLFRSLDLELLLPISDKMGELSLKSGKKIFGIGEEGKRLYLIVEGDVIISDRCGSLATLGSGEFFGEESLISNQPRAYSSICESDVKLLALSHTNLITILNECPTVAICLLQAYVSAMPFRTGGRLT